MTIIDSGIASPTRASAPTAIHGSLMRSVSLCGLEDSVLRVVESGGGFVVADDSLQHYRLCVRPRGDRVVSVV